MPCRSTYDSTEYSEFAERTLNRIISAGDTTANNIHGQLFEATLEWVRLDCFPQKPSRLRSIFMWANAEQALRYADDAPEAKIIKVRPAEIRNIHCGDFSLIHWLDDQMNLQSFLDRAIAYWQGSSDRQRERVDEIVLDGKVHIVECLHRGHTS